MFMQLKGVGVWRQTAYVKDLKPYSPKKKYIFEI